MQLGVRREASSPLSENRKICSDFRKKGPDSVHLWVKFSIRNAVLGVSRRQNVSLQGLFFLFLMKCLVKCPSSTNPYPPTLPWKFSGCTPALTHYSFRKTLHLKCLTVLWISVSITAQYCKVTLWYVQHQIHSEFCHIQHSAFLGICWYIQSYSALSRHIHEYWDIIKAYLCLFRHIQHPV